MVQSYTRLHRSLVQHVEAHKELRILAEEMEIPDTPDSIMSLLKRDFEEVSKDLHDNGCTATYCYLEEHFSNEEDNQEADSVPPVSEDAES